VNIRFSAPCESSVADPDPHHFGNLDPHPHQIKIRIGSASKLIRWMRIMSIWNRKNGFFRFLLRIRIRPDLSL